MERMFFQTIELVQKRKQYQCWLISKALMKYYFVFQLLIFLR